MIKYLIERYGLDKINSMFSYEIEKAFSDMNNITVDQFFSGSLLHQVFSNLLKSIILKINKRTSLYFKNISRFEYLIISSTYTIIDPGKQNFSGGERQRIAIARLYLNDAAIIILDEATSALDNETAYQIEKNILSIEGKTIISITHKANDSIKLYDSVILMENGCAKEFSNTTQLGNILMYQMLSGCKGGQDA